MGKILRLINNNTYVKEVVINYTDEWIEKIITTSEVSEAIDINCIRRRGELAEAVKTKHNTLLEVVEILK